MATVQDISPARPYNRPTGLRVGPYAQDGGKSLDEHGPFTAIATYTGHSFDLCNEQTWSYGTREEQTMDIAVSLGNVARYAGHCDFYSVAEHSIRVSHNLRDKGEPAAIQLLGLWHDATEAYLGDLPRPQKNVTCFLVEGDGIESYKHLEQRLENVLFERHGLIHPGLPEWGDSWAKVKRADYDVYLMERDERPHPAAGGKYAMSPTAARHMWMLLDEKLRDV